MRETTILAARASFQMLLHRRQHRRVRRASQALTRSHIIPHAVRHLIGERCRQALEYGKQRAHGCFIGVQRLRVPIQRRKANPKDVQTAGEGVGDGAGTGAGGAAAGDAQRAASSAMTSSGAPLAIRRESRSSNRCSMGDCSGYRFATEQGARMIAH